MEQTREERGGGGGRGKRGEMSKSMKWKTLMKINKTLTI
jgi:hypothetical protein